MTCSWCGEVHAADVRCARCADCDAELLPPTEAPSGLLFCRGCRDEWHSGPPMRDDEREMEWDRTEQAWVVG